MNQAPDTGTDLPPVETQRRQFRDRLIEAGQQWRILFIGRFAFGPNDIVACLLRALRNIGHQVFYLNTDRHPDIIDNPHQCQAGFGPLFVRPRRFERILEAFDPQIILCCAGGYVFEPADAAWLKGQGRLLLGMTLSDPDVLDSVKDHVTQFDRHTTNARQALELYRQAGIKNTVWFPFGIDRDFVEAEVYVPPSLEADVICLGQGRAERNRVMKVLAKRFSAKVYGTGWELPTIGQVTGLKMLQASRGGRIHINFPGTVAGHVNVKCGVFESIASGALLCTVEFGEMRRFFKYGEEIAGYRDADDLITTLEQLLGDPERVERMRRRAFRRLIDEHLYEYRWIELFQSLDADLRDRTRSQAGHSVSAGATTQAGELLLLPGEDDELLVLSLPPLSQALKQTDPNLRLSIASIRPADVEKRIGLPAVDRGDDNALHHALAACDSVLIYGGHWHDLDYQMAGEALSLFHGAEAELLRLAPPILLASLYGRNLCFYGPGVGPLRTEGARHALQFITRGAQDIALRDPSAREEWQHFSESFPVVHGVVDPLFAVDLPDASEQTGVPVVHRRVLVVNLYPWERHDERSLCTRLATAIDELPDAERISVIGVGLAQDRPLLDLLLGKLVRPVRKSVLNWRDGPGALYECLRTASAVFAMRRPLSLLAYRLAIPALAIDAVPGVADLYRQLRRPEYCLPVTADSARLGAALRNLLDTSGIDAATSERIAELELQARQDLLALGQRLTGLPRRPKVRVLGELKPKLVVQDLTIAFNLNHAELTAGNLHDRARTPPFSHVLNETGLSFQFTESAPRKGDFLQAAIPLSLESGQHHRIRLKLRQPYAHRNMNGRIVYQVLADDRLFLEEDISHWDLDNVVSLFLVPTASVTRIAVRLLALRDCEPWGWGGASRLTIQRIAAEPCPQAPITGTSAESPYSQQFPVS